VRVTRYARGLPAPGGDDRALAVVLRVAADDLRPHDGGLAAVAVVATDLDSPTGPYRLLAGPAALELAAVCAPA
jgi:hypothetical protein